jgi:uncharacterized protein (UPF0147 family)
MDLNLDLADLSWTDGMTEVARRHFEDSMSIAKFVGDPSWLSRTYSAYGEFITKELYDFAKGLSLMKEATQLEGATDADLIRYARASRQAPEAVASRSDHLAEALQMLQQRIDSNSGSNTPDYARLLIETAYVALEGGDHANARRLANTAKPIVWQVDNEELIVETATLIGRLKEMRVPIHDPNLN